MLISRNWNEAKSQNRFKQIEHLQELLTLPYFPSVATTNIFTIMYSTF